jgi:hypothetical protein
MNRNKKRHESITCRTAYAIYYANLATCENIDTISDEVGKLVKDDESSQLLLTEFWDSMAQMSALGIARRLYES